MQRWEHKTVLRHCGWQEMKGYAYMQRTEWLPPIDEVLALGQEGWELVAAVPLSGILGGQETVDWKSDDFAGFTTDQLWVFRRPQS